jgi:putative hydrolase of the HAD superfamily
MQARKMINTVIFDLDDTLYDEIDYCKSGFAVAADFLHEANPSISKQSFFDELWNQFRNNNRTRTFNATLASLNLPCDEDLIKQLVRTYHDHRPAITLPADSRTVLEQLQSSYTLALLTDGFLPAQKFKVEALGIAPLFSSVIYTEELGRDCWKPSTAGFEKILTELNIPASQAVYVADNAAKDFMAPNRLGMTTIQITRPNRIHTDQPSSAEAAPNHTITALEQLAPLLRNL